VYLYPSPHADEDAMGICWARWSADDPDYPATDQQFFSEFQSWVEREWPFTNVVYPGRTVPWEKWLG
jgi:hypothetical protein